MDFEVLGDLSDIETIAAGSDIRDLPRLRRFSYEAHGIGKKELKAKRYLD